jgi:hypothetical protein
LIEGLGFRVSGEEFRVRVRVFGMRGQVQRFRVRV